MDTAEESEYKPPKEFHEDPRDPLVGIDLSDSTELWLIQWPFATADNQLSDFDGREVTLDLDKDGQLGSFEGSSGKSYEVVNFASQEPDATVFVSSASDSNIVGKITRRVSFVHYPEPSEVPNENYKKMKAMQERSLTLSQSRRRSATPTKSSKQRRGESASGNWVSMHSSGLVNSLLGGKELSKGSQQTRHSDEPSRPVDHSVQESGRSLSEEMEPSTPKDIDDSAATLSSAEKKSKKRKKLEN